MDDSGERTDPAALTEATTDIILGTLIGRIGEHLLGPIELDQLAGASVRVHQHKAGHIGDTSRLLHAMGDDHNRVLGTQFVDQVLHLQRGDRVER